MKHFQRIALLLALTAPLVAESAERETEIRPDTGNIHPLLSEYAGDSGISLSYLSRDWRDAEEWRAAGRAKMRELLAYEPGPAPLDPVIQRVENNEHHIKYLVTYQVATNWSSEAYLLIPKGVSFPAPAVMALHDHGGFYYYGKEKISDFPNTPEIVREFRDRYYGGEAYAEALARNGFVVLVPDAFYFGSQRLRPEEVSDYYTKDHPNLGAEDINEAIRAYNRFASGHETLTAKTIFAAGATWPGILFHGDRVALNYLLTRPEVDPGRIGCMGLSIGGFRSAHLFGLDGRIKTGIVAGWMTTYSSLLFDHLRWHTWMIYVPGQHRWLDLPDVASLNAPNPLMIVNCAHDSLFTHEGMNGAAHKLRSVYKAMGAEQRFMHKMYGVPHSLNLEMRDDAIAWLTKWLKPEIN